MASLHINKATDYLICKLVCLVKIINERLILKKRQKAIHSRGLIGRLLRDSRYLEHQEKVSASGFAADYPFR